MMTKIHALALIAVGSILCGACTNQSDRAELERYREADRAAQQNLKKFDDLNFVVFRRTDWADFAQSHHDNVVVTYPDGRQTTGLHDHLEALRWFFTFAPDSKVVAHPIRIGTADWTAVEGVMEGTFTKPMKMPDGRVIQPNGKRYRLTMATLGHWKDGRMTDEHVFADNGAIFQQLGVMP